MINNSFCQIGHTPRLTSSKPHITTSNEKARSQPFPFQPFENTWHFTNHNCDWHLWAGVHVTNTTIAVYYMCLTMCMYTWRKCLCPSQTPRRLACCSALPRRCLAQGSWRTMTGRTTCPVGQTGALLFDHLIVLLLLFHSLLYLFNINTTTNNDE